MTLGLMRRLSDPRFVTSMLVGTVLSALVAGFAAANTVPATKAGDGTGAITGFAISNVVYNVNGPNPGNIDSVTFTLDSTPAASVVVKIKLVTAGSTWYSCTNSGAAVTCATTSPSQATVATSDQLRVVVVNG